MIDFDECVVGTGGHYDDDEVISKPYLDMGDVNLKICYERKSDVSYEHTPPEVINCLDVLNHFDIDAVINLYKSDKFSREFIASFTIKGNEFFVFRDEWWLNNQRIRNIKNAVYRFIQKQR